MKISNLQLPPAYHRPLRWAFWCQFAGIILANLVLDFGRFSFLYLCVTLVFWMVVGVLALTRSHPTLVERIAIGLGPQIIFWTMFIAP